jgi:flavin reductase (DIM6/NTAB) family NADH-FMN oxidoreductase RutF
MRHLAASVTIISANDGGVVYGMTATAVTSLTLDPPSLVICVNKHATIHDPLLRSGVFCVNLLRPDHQALSAAFSGNKVGRDRFTMGAWSLREIDPPRLKDGQAAIFCDVAGTLPYGTDTIIVGRVRQVDVAEPVTSRVYQTGCYGRFVPLASIDDS